MLSVSKRRTISQKRKRPRIDGGPASTTSSVAIIAAPDKLTTTHPASPSPWEPSTRASRNSATAKPIKTAPKSRGQKPVFVRGRPKSFIALMGAIASTSPLPNFRSVSIQRSCCTVFQSNPPRWPLPMVMWDQYSFSVEIVGDFMVFDSPAPPQPDNRPSSTGFDCGRGL